MCDVRVLLRCRTLRFVKPAATSGTVLTLLLGFLARHSYRVAHVAPDRAWWLLQKTPTSAH